VQFGGASMDILGSRRFSFIRAVLALAIASLTLAVVTQTFEQRPAAADPISVPQPGSGPSEESSEWQFNGSAEIDSDGNLSLTQGQTYVAGSAWYKTELSDISTLTVSFNMSLTGGSGADGVTVDLLDASDGSPSSLGGDGGDLGWEGLQGIGAGFHTYEDGCPAPSANYLGIVDGTSCGTGATYLATNDDIPTLSGHTNAVIVTFTGGAEGGVSIEVNGVNELTQSDIDMPSTAYFGFTGSSGAETNNQVISDFQVVGSVPVKAVGVGTGGSGGVARHNTTCVNGDPVNCASGDFIESTTDVSVSGRGPELDLTRTYNSLEAATEGMFGYGWTSSYDTNLVVNEDDSVTITVEDGSQVTAEPDDGSYSMPSWSDSTLTHDEDGTWTYLKNQTETYTFNSSGELTGITDLNGYSER
jgi:hypothetical protein